MNPEDVLAKEAVTYAIDISTATTTIVRAIAAGRRFHIMGLFLRANGVQVATLQSEGNALTGPITFADAQEFNLPSSTVPHLSGAATGEDFKITTTQAVQLSGWVQIAEEK